MNLLISIGAIVFFLMWLLLCFYVLISWFATTPYYPSRVKKLKLVFEKSTILKNLPKNKKFIDVGSGDGRVTLWAAKHGFKSYGVELNPFLTLFSRFLFFINRTKNAKVINKNFYNLDFSEYDIVYLYIYREHMNNLKNKLKKELNKGTIVISNTFTFDDWQPDEVVDRFKIYKI